MNDVMSLGIHRYWKQQLIKHLNPLRGTHLLDTCGGTGDVAFEFIRRVQHLHPTDNSSKVVVCDINEEMLKVGPKPNPNNCLKVNPIELSGFWGTPMNLPFDDNTSMPIPLRSV